MRHTKPTHVRGVLSGTSGMTAKSARIPSTPSIARLRLFACILVDAGQVGNIAHILNLNVSSLMCSISGAHQGRPGNMSLVLLLSQCLHLLLFLLLSPREVICACYAFWLVVSHGLKCIDKVYEL